MKKFMVLLFVGIIGISLIGCGLKKDIVSENSETTNKSQTITEVDYSSYFNEINGCAALYDYENDSYFFYNSVDCEKRYSPNSIFKIVSTIEGLDCGIVKDENSKMKYNGNKYPFEAWEQDLGLGDAYKYSCVWYYRQLIDKIGEENIHSALLSLDYGNCDITKWYGEDENGDKELNGFWLGSSLEISPVEAVRVTAKIFEGKTNYSIENINILKNIMKSDTENIYGKTGTGKDNSAWYTGFYEKDNKRIYFAVHIIGNENKTIAGADAKAIAENIIKGEV